jgi:hypothetical protein
MNIRDLYKGITEFKKGYQPRTNMVKDPHKIVNRGNKYFCQLLNVQEAGGVRQTEIQKAEPFVPQPSISEVEVAIVKLKRYRSSGVDQIPTQLIQAAGEIMHSEVHMLIKLICNKEELPHQWKGSIVIPLHKKSDKTDYGIYRAISLLSTSYKMLSNIPHSRLILYADEINGDHQCGFQHNRSMTDIDFLYPSHTGEKVGV